MKKYSNSLLIYYYAHASQYNYPPRTRPQYNILYSMLRRVLSIHIIISICGNFNPPMLYTQRNVFNVFYYMYYLFFSEVVLVSTIVCNKLVSCQVPKYLINKVLNVFLIILNTNFTNIQEVQ